MPDECNLVSEVRQHFIETSATLRRWSQTHPRLNYLFHPVEQWLATQDLPLLPQPETNEMPSPSIDEHSLINSLLITVQNLVSKCPEPKPAEAEGEHNDQYILQGYRVVRDFTHLLNIDTIVSELDRTILRFASHGTGLHQHLRRILPFLDHYLDLVKDQLTTHSRWTKALFKLNFVTCSVLHTLSTQGFCKPPDFDDSKDGEDAAEGLGGVGLGEGSGSQNVSKDIEDESQVEGLQGEEEQEATDNKNDNDAIEMSGDLGGDMEDVPDAGSQDDEGSDQESDVDPEERLGNLDATDPSAIDEKLWGDEKGPEDNLPQEKTTQDHSEKQSGESEVTAKEGSERPRSKDQPSDQKEAGDEKTEDEPIPDVGDDDLNDPEASGAPMDDYVQDANTLDLPDDMDLSKDDKDLGEDLPEDMEVDNEEPVDDAMDDGRPESNTDDATTDPQIEAPLHDNTPEHEQDTEMPGQPEEVEGDPETEATGEDAIARPDVSTGNGVALSDPSTSDGRETASGGQAGPSEGAAGEDVPSDDKQKDE
jgi:midasin